MSFIETIKAKAKSNVQTIVLPESLEKRTLVATEKIIAEGLAKVILIGKEEEIKAAAGDVNLEGAVIVDPASFEEMNDYVDTLVELRSKKGMTEEKARELLTGDPLYLGVMMVKKGMAGGMVAGAVSSTANVLRPSLQILKTAPGTKLVSSFFVMVVPDCDMGANGTFVFSDCGLVQNPSADELASIAGSSAGSFQHWSVKNRSLVCCHTRQWEARSTRMLTRLLKRPNWLKSSFHSSKSMVSFNWMRLSFLV